MNIGLYAQINQSSFVDMHNGYAYGEYYLRFFTKPIDSEIEQNYNNTCLRARAI